MFSKKTYILIAVCIALGIIAWLYVDFLPKKQAQKQEDGNFLSGITVGSIDEIEVNAEGKTVAISKRDNVWSMRDSGFKTDSFIIDSLIERLTEMTSNEWDVASVNAEKKATFGLDTPQTVVLKSEGREVGRFLVGKVNSSYTGTYIGRENDATTYVAPVTLVRALDTASWPDLTLFSFTAEQIDTVTVVENSATRVFTNQKNTRNETFWRQEKPTIVRLDEEKVTGWLSQGGGLAASGIADQNEQIRETARIIWQGKDFKEVLVVGEKKGENYTIKKESSPILYTLSVNMYQTLFKPTKDLQ